MQHELGGLLADVQVPVQLGLRQARYRGRLKTEAQLLLAATVANLTRLWAATRETPSVSCPGT